MVAGLCCIATCVFILVISAAYTLTTSFTVQLLMLVVALVLYIATLVAHIQGYVYLGKKCNSVFLIRSAQLVIGGLVFFGIAYIAWILAVLAFGEYEPLAIAVLGLSVILLLVPALLFAVAILRMYRLWGITTIASAALVPAAVFIVQPWPTALVVAISTYFFYRATKGSILID